ncbi:MAG: acetyl-CoA carboxylase biotin carboxylase subunit [Kofleriaceae bacterium]|jgi:acetyl-CoA carboxylase biotin carboxylase subunit|nr:acetyl-CoA carboxylase biotin carboxylase subunit [Kofleriaceae bacterium]MBP6841507.1 acetyl-CoA carboxylase biotin carboxylase subunit [Kofleriaceae bacterium]MBP9206495.1 acetyl-CoA carboxylase biotin carboxylase subunit [Kofleriaceae bacterium]
MFRKVLVANRGEIALRVIRCLRELGLESVAVYSTADADALHVKFADQAVCIGPPPSRGSYLNIPSIISAAEITGADAIHPGYGFLSENAEFAEVCGKCGLTWIGPPPHAMRLMGDKIQARAAMRAAGVPMLPGTGSIGNAETLYEEADRIGLPVILKATAGGGGRGMKIVSERDRLLDAWNMGRTEAAAAFGNPDMYMERYAQRPRHIEIQVVADKHGHYAHLGERECSLQRRHQKVLEEAPSAALPEETRTQLTTAAVRAIEAIGYTNVGTLEFLLDSDGRFYFMEMNTRLQVEHPVTELVTGLDLVREQIRIAAGEPLSFSGERKPRGHAIELRVNAEDPETFAPWPGRITGLHLPGGNGVRVDTHMYEGYVVPSHYDSLLAKVIVHDDDREAAIRRARRCLAEMVVEGPRTNIPFLRRILNHPDFVRGDFDTGFVARMLAEGRPAA